MIASGGFHVCLSQQLSNKLFSSHTKILPGCHIPYHGIKYLAVLQLNFQTNFYQDLTKLPYTISHRKILRGNFQINFYQDLTKLPYTISYRKIPRGNFQTNFFFFLPQSYGACGDCVLCILWTVQYILSFLSN